MVENISNCEAKLLPREETCSELDDVMPIVYLELKRLAAHHLRGERQDHSLKPTDLVHETYLQLRKQHSLDPENTSYLLSIASTIMRRILVNSAKYRKRKKRGDGIPAISLEAIPDLKNDQRRDRPVDVLAVEFALSALEKHEPRQVRIVEYHFYGGLTFGEIAAVLGLSRSTIMRQWKCAREWLSAYLRAHEV